MNQNLIIFFGYRVDESYSFQYCDVDRISKMFEHFYPNADIAQRNMLLDKIERNKTMLEKDPISPIELQRHFFKYSEKSSDAIENLHILRKYLKFDAKLK